MRIQPFTVALAMALVATPALANHHEGHAKPTPAAMLDDAGFMKAAAMGGLAEVAAGKLAATKAASAEVKAFAQMMVTDHGKANAELMALAKQKGVALPAAPDAMHQAHAKQLAQLTGVAFDKGYVAGQVKDHEKTVKLFQAEAAHGKDAGTRAWAAKTLPTLQMHLDHAKELHADVQK